MTLGEKLKESRQNKHLTLKKLAKVSGVGSTTLWLYENDKIEPTFFKLICLADVLDISLDWLAGRN